MKREGIETEAAPKLTLALSQGVVAGGFLFVSGQVPINPETGQVPVDFAEQVRQALNNVQAIAHEANADLSNATRVSVYLTDLANFDQMEAVYKSYFSAPYPARTTTGVKINGYDIEVDAIIPIQ